jgi:hypothetical protein
MTHGSPGPAPDGVPPLRKALVELGLIGLLFGAAFDIYTRREHWPFSHYPMFSRVRQEARVLHHAIVAVPRDGSAEFPLYKSAHLHPFHWYRHRRAFKTMLEEPDRGVEAARIGLADCLERYERNRRSGRHDGPPLRAVRLYRVEWAIDPDAPDLIGREDRTFVAEVASTAGGPTDDR